jgi:hypothetical protein
MRHRTPDHVSISIAQIVFASCFFVWRLVLGTFGTYHYWVHSKDFLPRELSDLWRHMVGVTLVLASALQWFWGVGIIKMASRKLRRLEMKRETLSRQAKARESKAVTDKKID